MHPSSIHSLTRARRTLGIAALSVFLASALHAASEPRVILVSWDGAGFAWTSRMLDEGRLPNLKRMLDEGAWTDGMVASFPTKTAAAHAVLFTGHYGHRSGITANSVWKLPPEAHDRLSSDNGYFSTSLRVDPIWYAAARAGRPAVALHATQAYPFAHLEKRLSPSERARLFVVHGYTETQLRGDALSERDAPLASPAGWTIAEAGGPEARAFRFEVADESFWGLVFDDPLDPVVGCDTVGVVRAPEDGDFEARITPGADSGFSIPVRAMNDGVESWFAVRLFELSPSCDRFLLYRSGANRVALSNPSTKGAGQRTLSVFAGNGGGDPYARGAFGPRLPEGGDGTAESRFIDTLQHLERQIESQSDALLSRDYGLAVVYSPISDDVAHELGGYIDPSLPGHDPELAERIWSVIAQGFELQDRYLGSLLDRATRDGSHVVLVSDHGMASTDHLVHVNLALAEAGLLRIAPDGRIDLSQTRALMPPLADASVGINTVDRAGGVVPMEERAEVLAEVRRVLAALVIPGTEESVVTAFYEPATVGLLQPGGITAGDVFLDFAPGYYPSSATGGESIIERTEPAGNHIFLPTRRDMLAIFAAWGPRIAPGNWGRVRSVDVAPTVLDLLELSVPGDLPGRSLVPARTLLSVR